MKAIVFHRYGQPDVLSLEEIAKPSPKDDEVLVKVYASCINSWDYELIQGIPFINRLMSGLLEPTKIMTPGCDIAGRIESVGKNVKRFKVGDEVYGDLSSCGWGGFAEYVAAPEKALVLKPACLTFEQAAAVPQAALLALQGLQKGGGLKKDGDMGREKSPDQWRGRRLGHICDTDSESVRGRGDSGRQYRETGHHARDGGRPCYRLHAKKLHE